MILILLVGGLTLGALYLGTMVVNAARDAGEARPRGEAIVLGAVTNIFDTLGIGSFAPSIAWMRFRKLVPDRLMPLTMTIGAIPAVLVAAFIVKSLPLTMLRWLVAVVVTYAGVTLLLAATRKADVVPEDAAEAAVTH